MGIGMGLCLLRGQHRMLDVTLSRVTQSGDPSPHTWIPSWDPRMHT